MDFHYIKKSLLCLLHLIFDKKCYDCPLDECEYFDNFFVKR